MSTDNRQHSKISKVLADIGLSEKESLVYLSLLKLGTAKAVSVASKSDLRRTTVYDILRQLTGKGLISKFSKKSTTFYSVSDPQALLGHLDREHSQFSAKMSQKKIQVEQMLPELVSIAKAGSSAPKVRFYEGRKGIREAYEDTLTSTGMICAYADFASLLDELEEYFPDYLERRIKKKIFARAIAPDTQVWRERLKVNQAELRDTRFLPAGNSFTPEINIYNNKMLMVSWKEKMAVIIESKDLIDLQKIIFEQLWDRLPQA